MQSINEDIKNQNYKPVYLLYGEEDYLKRTYRDKLIKALIPEGDTMNLTRYQGKNPPVTEIIDTSETMPFFAERRLIVIEESGLFKGQNELCEYLKGMPDTTCFLFVEKEVDKRNKLFKSVKDKGRVVELVRQNETTLTRWVLGILKSEGKMITQSAMQTFLMRTGSDMENIQKELEKLICYTWDKQGIELADVEAVCTVQIQNRIFDMVHAISSGDKKKALSLYQDLLALKEPPMRILFLIAREFNILLQVKELAGRGNDASFISKKVGLQPFLVGKYTAQARKYTKERLRHAVEDCVEAEEKVKTGRLNDSLSVEMLIVKYSEKAEY